MTSLSVPNGYLEREESMMIIYYLYSFNLNYIL